MSNSFFLLGLVSLAAGIFVSGFLYFKQRQAYSKTVLWSLFLLRALAFALLFFVLIAPFITFNRKEIKQPIVAVLVDNSSSMLLGEDSAQIKQQLFSNLQKQLEGLENAEAVFYNFDDDLQAGAPNFKGSATDLANAMSAISKSLDQERLAAIVVASDGIVNLGMNPFYQAERSFLPIYSIALGDSAKQKDLAISQVRAPEYVFRGDEIAIDITVSAENAANFTGEIAIENKQTKVASRPVKVTSDAFAKVYSFVLKAGESGLYSYTAKLSVASGERNVANNERQFFVEVIENRKKIVVVSTAPSPDVQALREALKKVDAYDVSYVNPTKNSLPEKPELLVLFIQAGANQQVIKNSLKNYNGPLWLVVDPYADAQSFQGLFNWLSKVGNPQSIPIKVTQNPNFGLFKLSKEASAAINNFPGLNIFTGTIRASGSFENFLTDAANRPIASFGSVENRKVVLFNFSGLWGWRMADFRQNGNHKSSDEFLQLSAQYLTASGDGNRLKLSYEKRVSAGANLKIMATVYDATFTESNAASVKLELRNEENQRFEYNFSLEGNSYQTILSNLEPGKYSFTASAKLGEENLQNSGAFYVETQSLEALNTRANFPLLMQLSESTQGKFYTLATSQNLAADLNASPVIKPIEKIRADSLALIELKWIFFLILMLFAAEWTLRRYFGKI